MPYESILQNLNEIDLIDFFIQPHRQVFVLKKNTATVSPPDRGFGELFPRKRPPSRECESQTASSLLVAMLSLCNLERKR